MKIKQILALAVAAVAGLVLCGAGLGGSAGFGIGGDTGVCLPAQPSASGVPGFDGEQTGHAATIVAVGARLKVPPRGWVVAVATAMQESGLRNLAGGDRDSVGLFQQRPSMGWGTVAQLRDPAYAAAKFYQRLLAVSGWEAMPVTVAAQAVQRSAYPDAYAKHETAATALVAAVAGGIGDLPVCPVVGAQGWTVPVKAPIVSEFRTGQRPSHQGVDLGAPRGTMIRAAAAGRVVQVICNIDPVAHGCDRDGSPSVGGCDRLTAPSRFRPQRTWLEWRCGMSELRAQLLDGLVDPPRVGEVVAGPGPSLPYVLLDAVGGEVSVVSGYLRTLVAGDRSPLTVRSYAFDLLRWWRVLGALGVSWDRATTDEVVVLVAWLRAARNPQRRAGGTAVNVRTGKPRLGAGYAASTINHALSVVSGFYEFQARRGEGPVINPVPVSGRRRQLLAHRSPLDAPPGRAGRAPLRQRQPDRVPRAIPDRLWDELFAAMRCDRDRALLAFYVSCGARAGELLGLRMRDVDWAGQRIWVVSKGSRELEPVPASPQAFTLLALYLQAAGTPAGDEPVWRTLRGPQRPLSYWAMRRVLQRANDVLGTNWTLHDARHTAASRMANDPGLTLPQVQTVMRHRHLSTTQRYLTASVDEVFDRVQAHLARPRPEPARLAAGYDPADVAAVFGG